MACLRPVSCGVAFFASRRLRLLRLVPPPPRLASLQACTCEPTMCFARMWRIGRRNARRGYAQGVARLARYPPHDDRQHTARHTGTAPHGKARRRGRSLSTIIRRRNPLPAKSLHGSFSVPKICFPLILLALSDIRDNLSQIFRDKGALDGNWYQMVICGIITAHEQQ